eukprot:218054_1
MSAFTVIILNIVSVAIVYGSNTGRVDFSATNTGVAGHIGMLNGFVWVDLDFSQVDWTNIPGVPENCSEGGLKFHIHDKWTYNEKIDAGVDRKGTTACGDTYAGGHYDPWFACGPKSGASDCEVNNGCIPSSSIWNDINMNLDNDYVCNPVNYSEVAYTCEVGDLSSKYGLLEIDETTNKVVISGNETYGSYWEPSVELLYGEPNFKGFASKSIVIHCNSGERAFCAPILRGQSSEQSKDLTDDQTIETTLEDAGDQFKDMFIKWKKDSGGPLMEFLIPDTLSCATWDLYLYNEWPYDDYESGITADVNCDLGKLGGIYDPTHTCIANSSSEYCSDGKRCDSTSVTYSCTVAAEYYDCAVGDIVGRIGTITGTGQLQSVADPLSPPLFTLGNKAVVFVCTDTTTDIEVNNICALTVQTNGTVVFGTPAPTDDGLMVYGRLAFMMAMVSCVLFI